MPSKEELTSLTEKVASAMMSLKGGGIIEKYPIGLVDMNLWEWPQGVGLYGLYKHYQNTGSREIFDFLLSWFDNRIKEGLPERNINTTAPLLTLIHLYEKTEKEEYGRLCGDWAQWLMSGLLRTGDHAFQHMITGDKNDGQILIDTLFMAGLFLAKAGKVFGRPDYAEEAKRQFLVHIKYLTDTKTGLFFHGFDFNGMHNYGRVHWARGNCWYTVCLVELLEIIEIEDGVKGFLTDTYVNQVKALVQYQGENGLWRTVIDEEDSYEESSATAGFGYGLLKGIRMNLLKADYKEAGLKALRGIIGEIDENGVVQKVSYGTPVGNDSQFYKDIPISPMTYGQALTILFLAEAARFMEMDA